MPPTSSPILKLALVMAVLASAACSSRTKHVGSETAATSSTSASTTAGNGSGTDTTGPSGGSPSGSTSSAGGNSSSSTDTSGTSAGVDGVGGASGATASDDTSSGGTSTTGSSTTGATTTDAGSGGATQTVSTSGGPAPECTAPDERSCSEDGALGSCADGIQTCTEDGEWGPCSITPGTDTCEQGNDDSCDGTANEDCPCNDGETQDCGPPANVGICVIGTSTCVGGSWGDCVGAVLQQGRDCSSSDDNNCDGSPDSLVDDVCQCAVGNERNCQTHPEDGIGVCQAGSQTCELGPDNSSSFWGDCSGAVAPGARDCSSAADNDCDGKPDNGTGGPSMVELPQGYCIDSTEVTRAQYASWLATVEDPLLVPQSTECAAWNTDFTPGDGWPPGANPGLPVISVDWCDAVAFCQGVGKRLCGGLGGGTSDYSLFADETESQWYNACSSNGAYTYPYGNTQSPTACNTWDSTNDVIRSAGSMQTCQPSVNGYRGVYDLVGNVAEWEDSCLGTGSTALCRLRGSSYLFDDFATDLATCQADSVAILSLKMGDVGFRCCSLE